MKDNSQTSLASEIAATAEEFARVIADGKRILAALNVTAKNAGMGNCSLRSALLNRMRCAKNTTQLAMFTPSPCISKFGAGKRQAVAKNSGTSEGVRKAWQKRKHSSIALSEADLHEAVHDAHGYLKETLGKEPFHQDIADHLRYEHGIKVHPNTVRDIIVPLTGPGSWLHAQGQKTSAQADAEERQAVARGRLLRHLNKSRRPKPLPKSG